MVLKEITIEPGGQSSLSEGVFIYIQDFFLCHLSALYKGIHHLSSRPGTDRKHRTENFHAGRNRDDRSNASVATAIGFASDMNAF